MIALYFVLASLRLAPVYDDARLAERMELAQAAVDEGATKYELQWLAAIAYRESTYRLDARGDRNRAGSPTSFCAYQIHIGGGQTGEGWRGEDLVKDTRACTRVALRHLRASLHVCKHLPESDRAAMYARGSCESVSGQRISRDRWALAQRALGQHMAKARP